MAMVIEAQVDGGSSGSSQNRTKPVDIKCSPLACCMGHQSTPSFGAIPILADSFFVALEELLFLDPSSHRRPTTEDPANPRLDPVRLLGKADAMGTLGTHESIRKFGSLCPTTYQDQDIVAFLDLLWKIVVACWQQRLRQVR